VLLGGRGRAATTQADVLVIGAGMAGVAAAATLRSSGINPIVLEGRPDRIGGRIWTSSQWADAPVDLGASWLTHESINPLAKLAKESGIATVPSELLNLTLSEANGQILPEAEVERLLLLYFKIYARVKLLAAQRMARGLPDLPASNAFAKIIPQERLSPATLRRLGFFLNLAIKEPEASPLSDLSLYNWDNDYVFVQLYSSVFPKGYVQLVKLLSAGLDIRLDHRVSEIAYRPGGVTVSTNHGEFHAPYAVVTLPHGVLSSGTVRFTPPLPAWKQGAIDRLHTGLSDKFYLRFRRLFWNPEPDTLGRVAETSESRWSSWFNFYKYTGGIPMLMVFNHSHYARQLEGMDDTQVMDAAMQVLRKQYGRGIPEPLGLQRSSWASDPFALGTVPHIPPGASGADYALMGQSVGPLGFAGDSTTEEFPTLVFGAYMTGVREAGRILSLLGQGSSQPRSQSSSPHAAGGQPSTGGAGQTPSPGPGDPRPVHGPGHKGHGSSHDGNGPSHTGLGSSHDSKGPGQTGHGPGHNGHGSGESAAGGHPNKSSPGDGKPDHPGGSHPGKKKP
jgi:monoamine oxidase